MLLFALIGLPFGYGLILYCIGRRNERARDLLSVVFAFAVLACSAVLFREMPSGGIEGIFPYGLHFTTDGFRAVYSLVTSVMWAGTTLFSLEYFRNERESLSRYYLFVFFTLGATQGVMLSADLMTSFVFFEILSFTSFTWVIHEETAGAVRAAYTYFFIAVIGGLVLFMGLVLMQKNLGTLRYAELAEAVRALKSAAQDASVQTGVRAASAAASSGSYREVFAAGVCVLIGFGAKAGMFPVHVWLPKAHPVAPSPSSALLSGVLTKVGIYGILMTAVPAFFGDFRFGVLILLLGTVTMALGAMLALFSVNLKRTLACSSMSQIGFILIGVAMTLINSALGAEERVTLANCGTVLHMVNHSMIKLVLFMAAGVFVMKLHALDLNEIRGYGRNKPLLKAAFLLGAVGIAGVPLFNGYLSKTLLHAGIVVGWETLSISGAALAAGGVSHLAHAAALVHLLKAVEWIFLVSGGLTFAYMLKLFICIFVEKHPTRQAEFDRDRRGMNAASAAAVFTPSLLMIVLGQPAVMKRLAAFMTGRHEIMEFQAFSAGNLKGGALSLAIGAAVYLVVVRRILMRGGRYVDLWPKRLDLEERIYRPALTRLLPFVFGNLAAVFGENKVLKPLAKGILALGKKAAELFGENRLIRPLAAAVCAAGGAAASVLSASTDALAVFLRKTVFREHRAPDTDRKRFTKATAFRKESERAAAPIVENFSFALMMTCIGILVIFGVILLTFLGK